MSKWEDKAVTDFSNVLSGATPSTNNPTYWNGEINWITPADLSKLRTRYFDKTERRLSIEGLRNCAANLLPAESIVMSSRAPIGYFAIGKIEFATNQGCKSFLLKSGQDADFHYYNFLFNVRKFLRLGSGSTFAEVSKKDVESISFRIPTDYSQQRKIARILANVDDVIEQTELTIDKLKKVKQGMMHDLFTRGIDIKTGQLRPPQSEAPELYKKSELGWIPKEWDVVAVQDFGSVVTGNTPSKNNISNWGNDFLWASPFDFYEKYIYETQTLLSNNGKKCARIVPAGSVLITCIASLGKNAIAAFEMAFNQQINAVIINRDNDNEYFYYNISNDGIRFSALAGQTAVPIINKTTFEKFKLTRALLPEQKLIADRISNADEHLLKTKKELNKYEKLKQGLMQDLLTGKVPVVPDAQDKGAN